MVAIHLVELTRHHHYLLLWPGDNDETFNREDHNQVDRDCEGNLCKRKEMDDVGRDGHM